MTLNSSKIGALTLHGTSNFSHGYSIKVLETVGSNSILAWEGSSFAPTEWNSTVGAKLGYSLPNPTQFPEFSNGLRWAGFTNPGVTVADRTFGDHDDDILIKLGVGNSQPAGSYLNTITFSILPN
jgi:hypothetical protein